MDQLSYMRKVDRALEGARLGVAAYVDRSIEMIRRELEHQHGARHPGALGQGDPIAFLAALSHGRRIRSQALPGHLFADPAWDILVELTSARLEGRQVTVKGIQAVTMVPAATSLRWLNLLVEEGLVYRRDDRLDRRCTIVALTDNGWDAMSKWLAMVLPGYSPRLTARAA